MSKIFVSIPAWEDTEIIKTMKKCIANAKNPNNIVFGLGINYENEPDFSEIKNKVLIVRDRADYDIKNPGIIQVRNKIRSLITDEEYYLSIDAHADFDFGWDDKLINDINELNKDKNIYVISKQIFNKENQDEYATKWTFEKINDFRINFMGTPSPNMQDLIDKNMVNDKYYINRYVSANFIFGKTEWIKSMTFPDYHGFPFEEPELSIALFCNGFEVVSPIRSECVIFAGNDPKYQFPYDEEWWDFVGTDRNNPSHWQKKWVLDDGETVNEVVALLTKGKNKYFSFEGLKRSVNDFYSSINIQV